MKKIINLTFIITAIHAQAEQIKFRNGMAVNATVSSNVYMCVDLTLDNGRTIQAKLSDLSPDTLKVVVPDSDLYCSLEALAATNALLKARLAQMHSNALNAAEAPATLTGSKEEDTRKMRYALRDAIRAHLVATLNDYSGSKDYEWSAPFKSEGLWRMRVVFRATNSFGGYVRTDRVYSFTDSGTILTYTDL